MWRVIVCLRSTTGSLGANCSWTRWRRWFRVRAGVVGSAALCQGWQLLQKVGLSIMLRTYFVQQWLNLSDQGVEELLHESPAICRFVGVDLGIASAPDETTVLRFSHLLEQHDLGGLMLNAVNVHLEAKGIKVQTGRSWLRPPSKCLCRSRTRRRNVILI